MTCVIIIMHEGTEGGATSDTRPAHRERANRGHGASEGCRANRGRWVSEGHRANQGNQATRHHQANRGHSPSPSLTKATPNLTETK